MVRPWIFLINTFLVVTEGSYILCKKLNTFTLGVLQGRLNDPFFAGLHAGLLPLVTNFETLYDAWVFQLGNQKSKTSALSIDLKNLQGEKIGLWDIQIQNVFQQNTPEYQQILPNRRKPFQNGKQETRIAAVGALSIALTGKQQLAAVKTDVDAFFAQLHAHLLLQKQNLGDTDISSDALEAARVAVCTELYSILGLLMSHFKTNPELVDAFFDTESIRNHEQTIFNGTVLGAELKLAMTHTFIIGELVRLVNKGNHDLRFALCTEANDALGQPSVLVTAGNETIVMAEELGDVLTQRFLKVQNLAPAENGKYMIMLL